MRVWGAGGEGGGGVTSVEGEVPRRRVLFVRLSDEELVAIRRVAQERGTTVACLVREWVRREGGMKHL